MLSSSIASLAKDFSIKNLDEFSGIEAVKHLFPSQVKYAVDILNSADIVDCKPISTPSAVGSHLT